MPLLCSTHVFLCVLLLLLLPHMLLLLQLLPFELDEASGWGLTRLCAAAAATHGAAAAAAV
jgi:hypothetical protein